ncbi:flagellar protein FlgN [Alteromonas aestuariivivens]|uniref:Flagellar protein FlgN n=1 Tax=Alteromonas aestuariivivens TaxID=1938339 RepID=A0A3D8M5Q8_9ALTE|nr:flagellar export chaperone FlgN [Alteromonas aestuariivivens]RDV25019.1 flagellar protein FlgN [Alteromonas aestuariivivens]
MTGQSLHLALQQQVENLQALSGLLEQELHLISCRDAEALMTLLNEKEQTLEQIQKLDAEVTPLHQQKIAQEALSDEEQHLISTAQSLLDECKYRTEINQKAVEQGQLRLTHLRNLMMEVRAKESMTYDKKGKTSGASASKGYRA